MSVWRFFTHFSIDLFKKIMLTRESASETIDAFSTFFQYELISLSIRILLGFIASSVIVFSLISISHEVNQQLLTLGNGFYLSIISLSILTIVCLWILAHLLNSHNSRRKFKSFLPESKYLELDLQKITLAFYEGVVEGIDQYSEKQKSNSENGLSPPH